MQRAKERAELRKAKAPFKVKQAKADAKDEEEKERFNAINASEAPRRAMPSSEEKGKEEVHEEKQQTQKDGASLGLGASVGDRRSRAMTAHPNMAPKGHDHCTMSPLLWMYLQL